MRESGMEVRGIQRRTVGLLAVGQVLGGLGMGSTLSIGALLTVSISGSAAWSGMAATGLTLGAALLAIPLARLAARRGRRFALTLGSVIALAGAAVALVAAMLPSFGLLLLAFALLGAGSATNLQARFAAADLASPQTRGRDISLVVWSTTIGAVAGPNLLGPGETLGAALGLPDLTGPFLFTIAAQLLAAVVYAAGLRPDPLLMSRQRSLEHGATGGAVIEPSRNRAVFAILTLALSHAVMVGVMSMTPVHLTTHGASLVIVGVTISLHIAGMYALSPIWGIASDRLGRVPTILVGQGLLVAALLFTGFGAEQSGSVTIGLILLGLGWSASTVSASALVTESVLLEDRPRIQGRADFSMNLAGAAGGALAGVALAFMGYSGLSFIALALVVTVVVAAALLGRPTPPVLSEVQENQRDTPAAGSA